MNLRGDDPFWYLITDPASAHFEATYAISPEQGTTISKTKGKLLNPYDNILFSTKTTTRRRLLSGVLWTLLVLECIKRSTERCLTTFPVYAILADTVADDDAGEC